jgi:hypothetical protein
VEAAGIELCVAFLLGIAVGYAIRAAISSIRRANIRRRREDQALSYAAQADRPRPAINRATPRSAAMQHYRTYFLDENGHISNAIDMKCTDDEQAKECAKKFISGRAAELWREDRLIATYAAAA